MNFMVNLNQLLYFDQQKTNAKKMQNSYLNYWKIKINKNNNYFLKGGQ